MGSPITFSGLNGVDFNMILNAVMAQESQPLTALQTQKTALESQNSIFGTLATKLSAFETAASALGKVDSLASLSATSSGPGVGVTATSGTVPGTYQVLVSELARSQVIASQTTYTGLDEEIATGGSLTITPATGAPVTFTVAVSTTLKDLAAQINAQSDSPVSAATVQTSPGVFQLVLSGKDTGVANAFSVTSALTGGTGLGFTDTNGNGVSGDTAADNIQTALDASFTVNGLAITSSSNTATDVIPGVALTLKTKDPVNAVTVSVARDTEASKASVKSFISAYNDLVKFTKDQASASLAGKTNISRDPMLRGLRESIRSALQGEYPGGSTYTNLPSIGIGFDSTGNMTLDETQFDQAMATAPADVQEIFSGPTGTGGAFGGLLAMVKTYTQGGGLVAATRDRLTDQVTSLTKKMDNLQARLDLRRQSLQKEFMAADLAMSQLKSQGSALSAMGSQYQLF